MKVSVISDSPKFRFVVDISDPTLDSLLKAVATKLEIPSDVLASKYKIKIVRIGEDIQDFDVGPLAANCTVFFAAPADLKAPIERRSPPNPRLPRTDEEKAQAKLNDEKKRTAKLDRSNRFAGITLANVFEKLESAAGIKEREMLYLEFLENHAEQALRSSSFTRLSKPNLQALLRSNHFAAPELKILEGVLRWAKAQKYGQPKLQQQPKKTDEKAKSEEKGKKSKKEAKDDSGKEIKTSESDATEKDSAQFQWTDASEYSSVLEDILPLIRFPLLTPLELSLKIQPTKLVTQQTLLSLFKFAALPPKTRQPDELIAKQFSVIPRMARVLPLHDSGRLPLEIEFTDGGHYSRDYSAKNMLLLDSSVYCTQKEKNAHVVARCSSESAMRITKILAKAPNSGYTAPLGRAVIFMIDDVKDIELTSKWDNATREQYNKYKQNKEKGAHVAAHEPIAFIELKDGNELTVIPDFNRDAMYILIKLIMRREGSRGKNMDVEYIVFDGNYRKKK